MTAQSPALSSRLPQGLRALRHRNFRLFWTGQLISLIGTWMESVAQGWLILVLTNDPVALGVRAAAQFLPVLILGLFAGVITDSVPKRQALIVTQTLSGLLSLAMALLVIFNTVQPWEVYLLAALLGIVSAFDMPIRQSLVVELVGREDVTSAVALNSSAFNGTRIIGPAVAGVLIATVGLSACFLLNAISYIAVIVSLFMMDPRAINPSPQMRLQRTARSIVVQLAEGLRYIRNTRALFLAITLLGVVSTAALNFQVVLPLLAQNVLHGDATTYGFLNSAAGLGSLIGALALAFTGRAPTFRRVLIGAASIGVAMIGLGLSTWLPVSLVLLAVAGWGVIAMAATTNMLMQLTTPDHLRGRVISVYTTVFAGSTPIGGLLSGGIAAIAGTPAAFLVAGVATLATAGAAFGLSAKERALGRFLSDPDSAPSTGSGASGRVSTGSSAAPDPRGPLR